MSLITLLQQAGKPTDMMSTIYSLAPLVVIIGIFWFFIIRPQNKKQKETEKMINALKKGDKVVTIGGIHGVVSATKEKTVVVKVDDGVSIEFNRSAIAGVVVDKPAETKSKKNKKDEAPVEEKPAVAEEAAPASEDSSENK